MTTGVGRREEVIRVVEEYRRRVEEKTEGVRPLLEKAFGEDLKVCFEGLEGILDLARRVEEGECLEAVCGQIDEVNRQAVCLRQAAEELERQVEESENMVAQLENRMRKEKGK